MCLTHSKFRVVSKYIIQYYDSHLYAPENTLLRKLKKMARVGNQQNNSDVSSERNPLGKDALVIY
jgi:hypothetical protein